ncbi:MAG TPA: PD-(D/E)XK nuclease family protein [Nitrospinaceae bacterium]|jgi:hypothetical protein|nr:PD-(D/E)XK nuclease family protein [Nitrospinaceae bacterium]
MNNFPTNKSHVSYSEVKTWKECSFRHKLSYIDKINLGEDSPYLDYGTLLHAQLEQYLKTKTMDLESLETSLRKAWKKNGFDSEEYIQAQADHRKNNGWKPKPHVYIDEWVQWAKNSLEDIPEFLDNNFPNWEVISAEEELYEEMSSYDLSFKGFIDAIIECDGPRGKRVQWVIDWKTANAGGWYKDKRRDFLTQAQISAYKLFWRKKNNISVRDIKCGFVLLKRGAKPGKTCELLTISSGPKMEARVNKMIGSMIASVRRGLYLKNRNSCLFCDFKDTQHCP